MCRQHQRCSIVLSVAGILCFLFLGESVIKKANVIRINLGKAKYDDAVNAYTKIKDKYFQSYQAMDIDKYIEQAKLMKK